MKKPLNAQEERFMDELRGLLGHSFAEAQRTASVEHAQNGNMLYKQFQRGRDLFDRIRQYYQPEEPEIMPEIKKQPSPATTNGVKK